MTKKEINLHSIMYLLIRKIAEHTGFSVSGFTFHNVSINSILFSSSSISSFLFTFHNVSINSHQAIIEADDYF